jgi:hypothetical protein
VLQQAFAAKSRELMDSQQSRPGIPILPIQMTAAQYQFANYGYFARGWLALDPSIANSMSDFAAVEGQRQGAYNKDMAAPSNGAVGSLVFLLHGRPTTLLCLKSYL